MQVEEQNCTIPILNREDQYKETNAENNLHSSTKDALKKLIIKEGYISYQIHIKAIAPDGGNFLANLFEIDVIGETIDGHKEINTFVKQPVPAENLYGFIDIEEAYLKEVFFYNELSVIYDTLQREAGIPLNKRFKNVKCYSESNADVIIMENLTKKGYKVPFRMDVISLKFAESSIKQLARFHALSFVVEKKMPTYFENKLKNIKTVLNVNEKYIEVVTKSAIAAVEYFDDDMKKRFLRDWPSLNQTIDKYMSDNVSSVNCICHGDFRSNNILEKEESDKTDVFPIDYQLLFYGPPVTDLIYLLYTSTDTKFRQNHETYLKELYRRTMDDLLQHFNIDIETVFPRRVFESDYENMRDFGFFMSLAILPINYTDESSLIEPGCDLIKRGIQLDDRFQNRIAGLDEEYNQFRKNKIH